MIYYNKNLAKKVSFENKNDFFITLDFDKTITTKDSANSWSALGSEEGFSKEVYEETGRLYKYYSAIEVDYDMPFDIRKEKVIEWYKKDLDVFYKHNLTEDILNKCIDIAKLEFRAGLKDLFKWCYENNIIVIIVSAGIKNIIEELLKREDCYYDNIQILSNKLKFENGKMKEFDGHLIHTYNKNMNRLSKEIKEEIEKKNNILLFGDLIEDIGIVDDKDLYKTLTIGFLENNVEENLDVYQDNYDIVLTGEDATFTKAMEIINLKS